MHPSSASPVRVPDAGIYMVGMAVFPSHNPFHGASPTLHSVSQPPSSVIEVRRYLSLISFFFLCITLIPEPISSSCFCFISQMLLFPALSFVQAGRLSSLEFATQDLSSQVHVRFQIYRPHCHYHGTHLLLPSESHTQKLTNIHSTGVKKHISHLSPHL